MNMTQNGQNVYDFCAFFVLSFCKLPKIKVENPVVAKLQRIFEEGKNNFVRLQNFHKILNYTHTFMTHTVGSHCRKPSLLEIY